MQTSVSSLYSRKVEYPSSLRCAPRDHFRAPAVYIMTNKKNGILYVGVTSDLVRRVYAHKYATIEGFHRNDTCSMLVFYEIHSSMESALVRERMLKTVSRQKKVYLIEAKNPLWKDLYHDIIG